MVPLIDAQGLIKISKYRFDENGQSKDRYAIILNNDSDSLITFNTITSNSRIYEHLNQGSNICVGGTDIDIYHFPRNYTVCTNGFGFPRDSYIHTGSLFAENVDSFLDDYGDRIEEIGVLENVEFDNLIYHFIRSEHTQENIREVLERILTERSN